MMIKKPGRLAWAMGLVGVLAGLSIAGPLAGHPHLKAAVRALETAKRQLEIANNGKEEFHGDRAQAIQDIDKALEEVRAAAEFADANPGH